MQITAQMVKELREQTGAGMLDCKKALEENNGNFENAVDWLRKKGIAKAEKKAGRAATEGVVVAKASGNKGILLEVNAETDFVSKNEQFQSFVARLADVVFQTGETDVEKLKQMSWPEGGTVAEKITSLIATIGENMNIRRAALLTTNNGEVKEYIHMGGKIGVLVALEGATGEKVAETAKNIAMHVAAANPAALNRDSVDPAMIARERDILVEQARQSGKPENILEKIVEGRISKFYEESCLVEQAFVMDTDRKVGDVAKAAGTTVAGFVRFQLGEGLEKKADNFAEEVAKVANG